MNHTAAIDVHFSGGVGMSRDDLIEVWYDWFRPLLIVGAMIAVVKWGAR